MEEEWAKDGDMVRCGRKKDKRIVVVEKGSESKNGVTVKIESRVYKSKWEGWRVVGRNSASVSRKRIKGLSFVVRDFVDEINK